MTAGVATPVTVDTYRGVYYSWDTKHEPGRWLPNFLVTYSQTRLDVDGVEQVRADRDGGSFLLTFPMPGDHQVVVRLITTDGQTIASAGMFRVGAISPPAFTLTAPVGGATVDLGAGGGQVDVRVAIPADQFFPVTIGVAVDGHAVSTETTSSTTYHRTVALGPMPLGARSIVVTVADRDSLGSARTVLVTGRDVGFPRVVVGGTQPIIVTGDAGGRATVVLIGSAGDSQAGMDGGNAGVAWSLSPGGVRTPARALAGTDFTNWRADVPMVGFGAHTIFLWATDAVGNTMPDPQTVQVVVTTS